jgi:hypothetical protein
LSNTNDLSLSGEANFNLDNLEINSNINDVLTSAKANTQLDNLIIYTDINDLKFVKLCGVKVYLGDIIVQDLIGDTQIIDIIANIDINNLE